MSSDPPASNGMMWSASVAGALWQMTQVCGPDAKSSFRALRNSGVARRVMLVVLFLTPLAAPAVVFMLRDGSVRYNPPHFELLTQAVGCVLPADSHLGVLEFILRAPAFVHGALPTFRCVVPAECDSLRGRGSLGWGVPRGCTSSFNP